MRAGRDEGQGRLRDDIERYVHPGLLISGWPRIRRLIESPVVDDLPPSAG